MWCVTIVLIIKKATVLKSRNVNDRSHANKYLRNIKLNFQTKVEIRISFQLIRMQMSCVIAPPGKRS